MMALLVVVTGQYRNALFARRGSCKTWSLVLCRIRAKRMIDRLVSYDSSELFIVIRDGKDTFIKPDELVIVILCA